MPTSTGALPGTNQGLKPERPRGMSLLGAAILLFASVLVSLVVALTVDSASHARWVAESGPIETASILFHLGSVLVLVLSALFLGDRRFALRWALIMGFFAAREADSHNRFTTEGIFRTSYYFKSSAPIIERVLVTLVLLAIAYVVLTFLAGSAGRLFMALRYRTRWVVCGAIGLILLIAGKSLDASTWITQAIGTDWRPQIETVNLFEEITELAGAALLCTSALFYTVSQARRHSEQTAPAKSQ